MEPSAAPSPLDLDELSVEQLERLEQTLQAAEAKRGLYHYLRHFVWPIIEPAREFVDNWHIGFFCELFEAVSYREPGYRFVILNSEPRNLKSVISSIAWPTWEWMRGNPGARFILGSYSEDLVAQFAEKRRRVVQSARYQQCAPGTLLVKTDLTDQINAMAGEFFATMTGGTVAGFGGNVMLDDPMNPDWAESEPKTRSSNKWVTDNFSSRFDDMSCAFIVSMQRVGPRDTTWHLLSRADWKHIVVDALPAETRTYTFPRSGRVVHQGAGVPVCAKRKSVAELRRISRLLDGTPDCDGPKFMSQYRQMPSMTFGEGVKPEWLRFWHYPGSPLPPVEFPSRELEPIRCACIPLPVDAECDFHCQSWDLSLDDTKRSADTAGTVWARRGQFKFLRDAVASPMDFMAQLDAIESLRTQYPLSATCTYIENRANGAAVFSAKGGEWSGLVPVEPVRAKLERLKEVLPQFRAGEVVFPHPDIAPWVMDVIKQLSGHGKKRDIMDSVTQALKQMREPVVEWVIV